MTAVFNRASWILLAAMLVGLVAAPARAQNDGAPDKAPPAKPLPAEVYVKMTTSKGVIVLKLDHEKAPISVENFLKYADSGFYNGTIFHRVIPNFMIQGGGFTPDLTAKPTGQPIKDEWKNGLENKRGTIAMARRTAPDSATSQFFINVVDNPRLDDPISGGAGYAVFGEVVHGMNVVDEIRSVKTTSKNGMRDVPVDPVVIQGVERITPEQAAKIISGKAEEGTADQGKPDNGQPKPDEPNKQEGKASDAPGSVPAKVYVDMKTSKGDIVLMLNGAKAPITVANFLSYAKKGFYDGTIFHRVIPTFMIQGGGFTPDMNEKPTGPPIKNEWQNGLKNKRGTIAMARTNAPDSATAQFFINVVDNSNLDLPMAGGAAYAVFGHVVKGMDVVDQIKGVETATKGPYQDVPVQPVVIEKVTVLTDEQAEKMLGGDKDEKGESGEKGESDEKEGSGDKDGGN